MLSGGWSEWSDWRLGVQVFINGKVGFGHLFKKALTDNLCALL